MKVKNVLIASGIIGLVIASFSAAMAIWVVPFVFTSTSIKQSIYRVDYFYDENDHYITPLEYNSNFDLLQLNNLNNGDHHIGWKVYGIENSNEYKCSEYETLSYSTLYEYAETNDAVIEEIDSSNENITYYTIKLMPIYGVKEGFVKIQVNEVIFKTGPSSSTSSSFIYSQMVNLWENGTDGYVYYEMFNFSPNYALDNDHSSFYFNKYVSSSSIKHYDHLGGTLSENTNIYINDILYLDKSTYSGETITLSMEYVNYYSE